MEYTADGRDLLFLNVLFLEEKGDKPQSVHVLSMGDKESIRDLLAANDIATGDSIVFFKLIQRLCRCYLNVVVSQGGYDFINGYCHSCNIVFFKPKKTVVPFLHKKSGLEEPGM
jgi:hypothetical protein